MNKSLPLTPPPNAILVTAIRTDRPLDKQQLARVICAGSIRDRHTLLWMLLHTFRYTQMHECLQRDDLKQRDTDNMQNTKLTNRHMTKTYKHTLTQMISFNQT